MKILNVRLGLATNSSSTHSLIFLPKGASARSIEPESGRQRFGWDYFQLTTRSDKLDYLTATIYQQLRHDVGEEIAETVARDWCGNSADKDGNVDHQSELTLPRNWDGKGLNRDFFEDFKMFLMRDDIVIAGGNDNDERRPPALSTGGKVVNVPIPEEDYGSVWVARKDGDYWALFNRDNGAKVRMTFKGDDFTSMPERSCAPELIDIKITDYCPFDCAYCYQDSTKEGKHGDKGWITSLAYQLKELNVFEVALGGGETTLHPNFVDILQSFRWNGIVPNFTTKSLGWLRDKKQREPILKLAGAFAYSCEKASDVKELAELIKKNKIETNDGYANYRHVTVQHVVGVVDEAEFREILTTCAENHLPITLLGYKQVGRGPKFGTKPSSKWFEIVSEIAEKQYLRVGIDTALADRHWDDLMTAGIKKQFLTRKEGQFSCYIDAVQKTMNVSSYTEAPGVPIASIYETDIAALYRSLPA